MTAQKRSAQSKAIMALKQYDGAVDQLDRALDRLQRAEKAVAFLQQYTGRSRIGVIYKQNLKSLIRATAGFIKAIDYADKEID